MRRDLSFGLPVELLHFPQLFQNQLISGAVRGARIQFADHRVPHLARLAIVLTKNALWQSPSQTEIANLRLAARIDQNVGWLEVSVHNV